LHEIKIQKEVGEKLGEKAAKKRRWSISNIPLMNYRICLGKNKTQKN